jgi:RNA polymerase sigma-54 factor
MAGCSAEAVNDAREIIQEFEPPGCASIDLRECLLVQLRLIGYEPDDYVVQIVDQHLADLESRRYEKLAKTLSTTVDEVVECHRIIQGLEPKPGRNFDEGDTRYIVPDVYIVKVGEDFQVVLNDEGLPNLRINSFYRQMASSGNGGDAKSYIQDKMRSAVWLIRSIEQRQRTLRKVTESIVRFQRKFLLHGVEHLKPMVLKDVANDIGMHESTVCRATANKYVHTPQGIFELKYFFTSSIRGTDGTDVSSESVKQKIQQIISREDPRKPYSDQYIAEALSRDNIEIARRTVAKYREMLGILPSSKRKRYVATS